MTTPHEHKPEWCPDDVWEAALPIAKAWAVNPHVTKAAEDIARAILAERERCAKVAENWRPFPKPTSRAAMYWLMNCAIPNIAAAIRNRVTQEE